MSPKITRIIIFLLFITSCNDAFSLSPHTHINNYRHKEWNTSDGIPYSAVRTLYQSSVGHIWFGSRAGLARFDGVKFTAYLKENESNFLSDEIFSISEYEGSLYIGTAKGFVIREKNQWKRPPAALAIFDNKIIRWMSNNNGVLDFSTREKFYRYANGKVTEYLFPENIRIKDVSNALHADNGDWIIVGEPSWLVSKGVGYLIANDEGTIGGVFSSTQDLDGNYYVGHIHGITKITPEGKPNQITLTLNSQTNFAGGTFNGVIEWQYNDVLEKLVPAFTALSSEGISIWGSKLTDQTTGQIITSIFDSLNVRSTINTRQVDLPTRGTRGATITWQSSQPNVISSEGNIVRPAVGEDDAIVTLTALIELNGEQVEKTFVVTIKARSLYNRVAQFAFENNLNDSFGDFSDASSISGTIGTPGGNIAYTTGVTGQALWLDGSSGVLLPDNLISNYEYTVSFWINPTVINAFTPGFFAAAAPNAWLSFLPESWDGNTMLWSGEAWFDGTAGERIAENQWSHMAFTVNNGNVKVYLNGEEKFSGGNIADLFSHNDATFALGANYWNVPFHGVIDQFSVYDASLSQDEIIALDIEQLTNVQLLALVADQIDLGNVNAVIDNLILPTQGDFTSVITWQSSDNSVITDNGQVTRPAIGQSDQSVTLTAIVNIGGEQIMRDFTLLVKSLGSESPGLVAHYSFDNNLVENTANFTDATIIGAMIGVAGGNELYSDGVQGQALRLDGSTGVSLPDGLITNYQYSVSFWVNPTSVSDHTPMFFAANSGDQWLSFLPQNWWDKGLTLWSTDNGAWFNTQTGTLPLGQWSHVAFTVDNGSATIYVNGIERASWVGVSDLFTGNNATFALGVNYWPDLPFNGYIDEFKVFDQALAASDVAELIIVE